MIPEVMDGLKQWSSAQDLLGALETYPCPASTKRDSDLTAQGWVPAIRHIHRLMIISVCDLPGIIRVNPKLQSLNSHSWSGHAAWDPFPIGTPDGL